MSLKVRLIPVLLLKNGFLIRSERFETHQILGNPYQEVARFNQWSVDELIYIDITREGGHDLRREDLRAGNLQDGLSILEEVSKSCFMPLTWGGGVRTLSDMRDRFVRGADKVLITTAAVESPDLIDQAASVFGSQAIVVGVDALKTDRGYQARVRCGRGSAGGRPPAEWAREAESRGAGEIFIQSVDRDGVGIGYDTELIQSVAAAVRVPVIACGGVGRFDHYPAGAAAGASAVAAANIWHFKELSDRQGKDALASAGVDVRRPRAIAETDRRGRGRRARTRRNRRVASLEEALAEPILA